MSANKYICVNGVNNNIRNRNTSNTLITAQYDLLQSYLPERFGIIMDGWSCDNEHYIAVFATYTTLQNTVVTKLLSCGVQNLPTEEFGFTAEDIGDYLLDVLEGYNRTFDAVQFIFADNVSVNGPLCDLLSQFLSNTQHIPRLVPLVECASHRLNLAVKSIYETNEHYWDLVAKIDDLMKSLNTLKNRPNLSALMPLCPEIRNHTRWGSTNAAMNKYLRLKEFLHNAAFDHALKAKITRLSTMDKDIEKLTAILQQFNEVSMHLQRESLVVTLSVVCLSDFRWTDCRDAFFTPLPCRQCRYCSRQIV